MCQVRKSVSAGTARAVSPNTRIRANMMGVRISKAMLRRIGRDYVVSITFWMLLSFLIAWQSHNTVVNAMLPTPLRDLFMLFGVRYLTVALLTPPLVYIVEHWPIGASAPVRRTLAYLAGYVPFSLIFSVIRGCMLPPWLSETQSWGKRTPDMILEIAYGTFADILLLYIGIVIAAHTYFYFSLSRRQDFERLQLRQSLTQSELQALRIQLHPHFLFNTLQGISTLIDVDPATAKNVLRKLSILLRVALTHNGTDMVELADELKFLESYLDPEQLRLGSRLKSNVHVSPQTRNVLIPQLILQPLIENAIVHGIACSREGGWIDILATNTGERLEIRIRNSVGGQSEPGMGVGIANVKARLKHLYVDDASFEFVISEDSVACATLVVPALMGPTGQIASIGFPAGAQRICAS
jgi:two-component system, LytTR family, sensor kinase